MRPGFDPDPRFVKKENTMTTQADPIHWEASLEQAQGRAAQEDMPILLDFSTAPSQG
jgi:hypothetical protein